MPGFEETFLRIFRRNQTEGTFSSTQTSILPTRTRRIAVLNQKGGCGKTTTTVNLSACLAELGMRVLVVDVDPQGHATLGFGYRADDLPLSLYHALKPGGMPLGRILQPTYHPNLKLIPANTLLASLQVELVDQ